MRRALITPLALGCCLAAGHHLEAQSVRDSAGVRIVAHARNAQPFRAWTVDPQPLLQIGGDQREGPTLFSEIWGATRDASGQLLISDDATQQVRVFDSKGQFLRAFGRRGEGPGEFAQIRSVHVRGDSVFVIDTRRGATLFTIDGRLLRTPPPLSLGQYRAVDSWGVLNDGSVIQTATGASARSTAARGDTRIEMRGLFRVMPDHARATLLRTVPTYEFAVQSDDLVAFSPYMTVAPTGDRICFGRPVRYEISCLDASGKLAMSIRREVAVVGVTNAAREAYRQKVRTPTPSPGHSPPSQSRLDAIAARVHFAATFPAYEQLFAGVDGEVWVREFSEEARTRVVAEPPLERATTRWDVFDRSGRWVAAVRLPARLSLRQVGRDFVLGVSTDDDGVERVSLLRLGRQ